jgi:hypothetical protein
MITLKVSQVERSNVLETLVNGKKPGHGTVGAEGAQNRAREERIRFYKEAFLQERPLSP